MKRLLTSSLLVRATFVALFSSALLTSTPAQAGTYTQTRYPIVLAPGFLGFDTVLGIDYWYQIPQALRSDGARVFVTSASATNSSEVRGEQLLQQTQDILAISGAEKLNFIGHSHGGFSIRYVAAALPERTASLTLVGSPARGTAMGDLVTDAINNTGVLGSLVNDVLSAGMSLLTWLAGHDYDENFAASLASLSTAGAADFNSRYPHGVPSTSCGEGAYTGPNGIRYFSWSGTSPVTNIFDPLDYFFGLTSLAYQGKEANDGLVGRCTSHFGRVLRDNYNMNHGDEINHLFGITALFSTNPKTVYREQANRLKNLGL